jgi:hypothetical protein
VRHRPAGFGEELPYINNGKKQVYPALASDKLPNTNECRTAGYLDYPVVLYL